MTPLGSDVDPDVYCKKAKSEDFGGGGKPLLLLAELFVFVSVVIHSKSSGQSLALFLPNFLASACLADDNFWTWLYEAFVRATLAPLDLAMVANIPSVSLRAGLGGKTGTATNPALRQAKKAIVKSIDGG